MKAIIKKLIRSALSNMRLDKIIVSLINESRIQSCFDNATVIGDVNFYSESEVVNEQNDKSKIEILTGTHIRGLLLIFGYGGNIKIGENCYVGDHSRIWSGESIVIGNNVLISHGVNIMDTNAHEIDSNLRADGYIGLLKHGSSYLKGRIETSPIYIQDDVWIGFNSIIMKGVTLGKGCIVAAGSVVTKNVAPFTMVGGNPMRVLKELQNI